LPVATCNKECHNFVVRAGTKRLALNRNRSNIKWCDTFQDSTVRGVVYQLPARNGRPLYLSGYDNADNGAAADAGGPAAVDFGTIWEGAEGGAGGPYDTDSEIREAAYHADKLAERTAEEAREYDTAWQAGSQWAARGEEVTAARRELLELLAYRRAARTAGDYPSICATIIGHVRSLLDTISTARAERAKLAAGDYSKRDLYLGFYTGSAEMRSAFNDGAGETVL
jgi:hypothetical protein